MYDDYYDVAVTTTAPASLPEQKLMLQKLLEERFGLVVHRNTYPSPVYFLVRGHEVKLTPVQEAPAPADFKLLSRSSGRLDAVISMGELADWLYPLLQLPVVDKTGLTGLFDIQIAPNLLGGAEQTILSIQNSLGLNLERHQGTAESLVIEQSTRPQAN